MIAFAENPPVLDVSSFKLLGNSMLFAGYEPISAAPGFEKKTAVEIHGYSNV
jgi:hypothetical protein